MSTKAVATSNKGVPNPIPADDPVADKLVVRDKIAIFPMSERPSAAFSLASPKGFQKTSYDQAYESQQYPSFAASKGPGGNYQDRQPLIGKIAQPTQPLPTFDPSVMRPPAPPEENYTKKRDGDFIIGQSNAVVPSQSDAIRVNKERTALEIELQKNKSVLMDLEGRLNLVLGENDKLNTRLREMSADNELLRQKASEASKKYELETKLALAQSDNQRLNASLREAREEIELWKSKYITMEGVTRKTTVENESKVTNFSREMERMTTILQEKSKEAEVLRNKASALENVVMEKANLDSDYRMAKSRCVDLEKQLESMRGELERMKFTVADREREADAMRSKLRDYDVVQQQRRDLDKEIQFMKSKILDNDNRAQAALTEQERLNKMLNDKIKECDQLRLQTGQMNGLQEQRIHLEKELKKYSDQLVELEERLVDANREVDRANTLKMQASNDVEKLKNQLSNMDRAHKRECDDLTGQYEALKNAKSESDAMCSKLFNEKNSLEVQLQSANSERFDLSNKFMSAKSEIERLQGVLREKERDVENWRNKCFAVEQRIVVITDLETRVKVQEREAEQFQSLLTERNQELESWKGKSNAMESDLKALRKHVIDLENKITLLLNENERLNNAGQDLGAEIESERDKFSDIQKRHTDQLELARRENERIESELSAAEVQITKERGRSHELDMRANQLTTELKHVLLNLERTEQEKGALLRQVEALNSEIQQLSELENKIVILVNETDKLNDLLKESQLENDNIRAKCVALENNAMKLEQSRKEADVRLDTMNKERERVANNGIDRQKENEILRQRCAEMERELKAVVDLENKVTLLVNENMRLNDAVTEWNREADQWKARCADLESNNRGILDLEEKLQIVITDNERLSDTLTAKLAEIEQLHAHLARSESEGSKVSELMVLILMMGMENERLLLVIRDFEEMRGRNAVLEREMIAKLEESKTKIEDAYKTQWEHEKTELITEVERLRKAKDAGSKVASEFAAANSEQFIQLRKQYAELDNDYKKALGDVRALQSVIATAENDRLEAVKHHQALESHVRALLTENEKLNKFAKDTSNERDVLKVRLASEAQTKGKADQSGQEKPRFDNELIALQLRVKEYDAKLSAATIESQRLNQINEEKDRHLLALQERVNHIEENVGAQYDDQMKEAQQYINSLERKLATVALENDHLNELLNQSNPRAIASGNEGQQIAGLKILVQDLEEKVTLLAEENQKLANLNDQRLKDYELLRSTMATQGKTGQFDEFKKQVEQGLKAKYEGEINQMKTRHTTERQATDNFISALRMKLSQYEQRQILLGMEMERLLGEVATRSLKPR